MPIDEQPVDAQPADDTKVTPVLVADPFIVPDATEAIHETPDGVRFVCPTCQTSYHPRQCGAEKDVIGCATVPTATVVVTICCPVCSTQFDAHTETLEQTVKGVRSWKTAFLVKTDDAIAFVQRVTSHVR